jgi:hypothetical protein
VAFHPRICPSQTCWGALRETSNGSSTRIESVVAVSFLSASASRIWNIAGVNGKNSSGLRSTAACRSAFFKIGPCPRSQSIGSLLYREAI